MRDVLPRRTHVYGVGPPKTGTMSLSRLFERYRTRHEAHIQETLSIIFCGDSREKTKKIHHRDRLGKLECEVGYFLVYICGDLACEFPNSKFICTVRPPRSWLRSIIDQCINAPRKCIPEEYRLLRDYSFGPIPESYSSKEEPLARYGLHSLDGYLSYWSFHYKQVLDKIPSDRCLFVRTRNISKRIESIAEFVDIPKSSICDEESHTHKTSKKHCVLSKIEENYLSRKISHHCGNVYSLLQNKTLTSI